MATIDDIDVIEEIKGAVLSVVQQIHDNQYYAIVVSGKSQVISSTWFQAGWERLYHEEPLPKIFELGDECNQLLYFYGINEGFDLTEYISNTDAIFQEQHPEFWDAKGERMCYLDDFSSSGTKYKDFVSTFDSMGYEHMDFGIFFVKESNLIATEAIVGSTSSKCVKAVSQLAKLLGATQIKSLDDTFKKEFISEVMNRINVIADYIRTDNPVSACRGYNL